MSHLDIYTATGTWTCPSGVTSVDVECWAGGGSGGSSNSGNVISGAGGGAYSKQTNITVVPGNIYTVTVGAGGLGVTSGGGNNGGDSWFLSTATVLAKGGGAGSVTSGFNALGASPGGQAANGIGTTKHSGGNGGACNASGGPQGSAGGGGAGDSADGVSVTGFGNNTPGAGGATGGGSGGAANVAGSNLGGGGGPGATSGAGGRGELRITYTVVAVVSIAEVTHASDSLSVQTNYTKTVADITHATDSVIAKNSIHNLPKTANPVWTNTPKT